MVQNTERLQNQYQAERQGGKEKKRKEKEKTRLTDRYVCRLWRKTKEDDEVCSEREREEDAESSDNAHLHSGYATGETASVFEISLPASVRPPFLTSLSFFSFFFVFPLFWGFWCVFKKINLGPIVPSFYFIFSANFLMLHQKWRSATRRFSQIWLQEKIKI